jgi:Uri superfamily endonuclease
VDGVDFPSNKGTYILILRLSKPAHLTIGKLGVFDFPAGYYAYVGSAFGSGGLQGRLKHHLAPAKKPHWHIDYLRQAGTVCEVWYIASGTHHEHQWADALHSLPDASIPAPRFGASDCKCEAHLSYLPDKPSVDAFSENNNLTLPCHSVKISQNNDHMEIEL